jgi:hypothetical protein
LYARETTPSALASHVEDVVAMGRAEPDLTALAGGSAARFADHLAQAVRMTAELA